MACRYRRQLGYVVSGLLWGLGSFTPAIAQTQAPYRDFVLTPMTVTSQCRGPFENATDILINETNGGIGGYLTNGNTALGLSVQAFPIRQMGGEAAVRSQLRQMATEAAGNPQQEATPALLGEEGVVIIQYDRDGFETSRSITFMQQGLWVNLTGITGGEAGAPCSGSGLMALADLIARGLRFEAAEAIAPPPATQDIPAHLADARRVGSDRCLVGSWTLEALPLSPTLVRQGALLLSTEEIAVDLADPEFSGTQFLTIEADGQVALETSSFTTSFTGTTTANATDTLTTTIATTLNGNGTGNVSLYERNGEQLAWFLINQEAMTQETVVSYDGSVAGRRLRDRLTTYSGPPEPTLSDGVATYRCSHDTLTLTLDPTPELGTADVPPLTWRYRRL
ncbi:MAG TPA: hypothetical protein V6D02_16220 [Candidatus Obscuribacterales bacterium]